MQFENHRNAVKSLPSRPCVLSPASSRRASERLRRAAAGVRSPLESRNSLRAQSGVANHFLPVAARKRASFRLIPAAAANALITAANPSSQIVFSRYNLRSCFLTKPNSACRIPNPMMVVSRTAIG
jgi:hypothetical protein